MSREDYRNGEVPDQEYTAEEYSFDELAKGLASGAISRGQALKLVGAALLGVSSLGVLGGVAAAKPKHKSKHKAKHKNRSRSASNKATPAANGGNSDCTQFCQSLPPGADRGQCVSDAAHGTGLCYECGPKSKNPNQKLCGTSCVDISTDVQNCGSCGKACTTGQTCQSGSCLSGLGGVCSSSANCQTGLTCQAGVCVAGVGGSCSTNTDCASGICLNGVCVSGVGGTCTSDPQCNTGLTCQNGQCEAANTCTTCPLDKTSTLGTCGNFPGCCGGGCICHRTFETATTGQGFCHGPVGCNIPTCNTTSDCPAGWACTPGGQGTNTTCCADLPPGGPQGYCLHPC